MSSGVIIDSFRGCDPVNALVGRCHSSVTTDDLSSSGALIQPEPVPRNLLDGGIEREPREQRRIRPRATDRMRIGIVINPVAGPAFRRVKVERQVEMARRVCAAEAVDCEIVVTTSRGQGRSAAADFVREQCTVIVAWGGDGTVNEVASAVAFHAPAFAIVPSGSGNGLARELGISQRPERALLTAIHGSERTIDVGELDGRFFVNLAGVGFDASVAYTFSQLAGRGLVGYINATFREFLTYRPDTYTVTTETMTIRRTALLIELANGRQFGNGALIAPNARLDDGRLDLVVVGRYSPLRALWNARRLFGGTIDQAPDVESRTAETITISAARPMRYHIDGEAGHGGQLLKATVHPHALRIRVP